MKAFFPSSLIVAGLCLSLAGGARAANAPAKSAPTAGAAMPHPLAAAVPHASGAAGSRPAASPAAHPAIAAASAGKATAVPAAPAGKATAVTAAPVASGKTAVPAVPTGKTAAPAAPSGKTAAVPASPAAPNGKPAAAPAAPNGKPAAAPANPALPAAKTDHAPAGQAAAAPVAPAGQAAAGDVVGKVLEAQGQVTYNGAPLKANDPIANNGVLKTGPDGKAKVVITSTKTFLMAAANAEIEVRVDAKKGQSYDLRSGLSRWLFAKAAAGTPPAVVRTRSAAMGIRGTDFLAIANPGLQETELVCFEGSVAFSAVANPKDMRMVGKGQWGGIGGRFGAKIAPILTLPPQVLADFDRQLPKGNIP